MVDITHVYEGNFHGDKKQGKRKRETNVNSVHIFRPVASKDGFQRLDSYNTREGSASITRRFEIPQRSPVHIFTPSGFPSREAKSRGFCHRVAYRLVRLLPRGKLTKPLFLLGNVVWNNKIKKRKTAKMEQAGLHGIMREFTCGCVFRRSGRRASVSPPASSKRTDSACNNCISL